MIILVAEDEALIALMLQLALTIAGYRVLGPAADVAEAIRLCERERPHLALIDIRLRNGDSGVALARTLKARWAVPCLFLSAQAGEARAASDAALGVIDKPYDPVEVVEAVAVVGEMLAGRQPRSMPRRLQLFSRPGDPAG